MARLARARRARQPPRNVTESAKSGGTTVTSTTDKKHRCEDCPMRAKAEANPKAFLSRLWKWHTGWCPGWKAYQKSLAGPKA